MPATLTEGGLAQWTKPTVMRFKRQFCLEQGTAGKKTKMGNELILPENYKQTYDKIVKMIETAKYKVFATKALHGEVFPIG